MAAATSEWDRAIKTWEDEPIDTSRNCFSCPLPRSLSDLGYQPEDDAMRHMALGVAIGLGNILFMHQHRGPHPRVISERWYA